VSNAADRAVERDANVLDVGGSCSKDVTSAKVLRNKKE
jgi:hypothetical protein